MPREIGRHIIRLDKVDSTNSYLKKNTELTKEHGLVVITKMQTSGRGRLGRKFTSIQNGNVTFSVILHPNLPIEKFQLYSLLAGIVVSRVLEKYVDRVTLKWPNDVLVRGKKICGILIESIKNYDNNQSCLILGIGLNTKGFVRDYPSELENIITTLEEEMFRDINEFHYSNAFPNIENEKIFQEILEELEQCLEIYTDYSGTDNIIRKKRLHHKLILQEWLVRSKAVGSKIKFKKNISSKTNNSIDIGIIEGLSNEGFLKIRTESGQLITAMSGEIIEFTKDTK